MTYRSSVGVRIVDGNSVRVIEHADSIGERHFVFGAIGLGFAWVPLERHAKVYAQLYAQSIKTRRSISRSYENVQSASPKLARTTGRLIGLITNVQIPSGSALAGTSPRLACITLQRSAARRERRRAARLQQRAVRHGSGDRFAWTLRRCVTVDR